MLWCKYCNMEIDERCNLCKYKEEAVEKEEQEDEQNEQRTD